MSESTQATIQYGDHRDQAVIGAFEHGDEVSLNDPHSLYRGRTDVMNKHTLRKRVKHLTLYGPFEKTGFQNWRFTGGEYDE